MDDAQIAERVSALITEARAEAGVDGDVESLVALLHRAAVELNKSARANATATKGTPEWGAWAGLQNSTRGLVLQASTCRDIVRKLKARDEPRANSSESNEN